MASLQVKWPEVSGTKQKALDDALKMQKRVIEQCNKSGKEVPKYQLSELIGKGSFGRVYKATSLTTKQLVAVKIIDIDQSDNADPRMADTYSDLLKEINALQMLSDTGAKNINHVIEALPVGQSMWMITEYCAGGSVATLMKPTSPGGLQEKWIIPILREAAEAISWVHAQGIIHRDLKCANVLVTEVGDVQLCDFGVAGVIETKFDKRTTVIGTPHWMAPELFDPSASYGTEVDIWAFGAMVFEIASGLPPNVAAGMDFTKLGTYVKLNTPRLDGDKYSSGLKDLIGYCLQHDPAKRPSITQIQRHGYLFKTEDAYPTESLAHLVRAFKLWEAQGGDRRSLFNLGGAQAPADIAAAVMADDEWNFSTTAAFDQQVFNNGDAQDVYDVYGSNVEFVQEKYEETARPQKPKGRRRPPPYLPSVKAPLEKLFDPNTMSNYEDNSRAYYGRPFPIPPPPAAPNASDLPLRDDSLPSSDVRESLIDLDIGRKSLIDLDASLHGSELSDFVDLNTLKAGDSRFPVDFDMGDPEPFDNGPLSDPGDMKGNRRTQDWKFPSLTPGPAPPDPQAFRFPAMPEEAEPAPSPVTSRPPLLHRPTEPLPPSSHYNDLAPTPSVDNRASTGSLIDLDLSMPDTATDYTRPSTSHSDANSVGSSDFGSTNPFELEKHTSFYAMPATYREPSIYVSDESEFSNMQHDVMANGVNHSAQSNGHSPSLSNDLARPYSLSDFADMDPEYPDDDPTPMPTTSANPAQFPFVPPHENGYHDDEPSSAIRHPSPSRENGISFLPPLPLAPLPQVMEGQASHEEVKEELRRMAMSLGAHLSHADTYLSGLQVRRASSTRAETPGDLVTPS
ncbi:unnamed protein product [Clonostachys rosea f. rosea IK726]|jgi:serine/threonine protein kinase|uniref:non-specific serine/threonine protein kinase n=2 Tax=Bionectria ochroleuca TaxID=29856 RepID=A0A0B7JPQ6_BIOOC|nr:unnamed protein product [Clonostachys rosea f. rosea IK726]